MDGEKGNAMSRKRFDAKLGKLAKALDLARNEKGLSG
jgi:hypothetical protein